MSASAFFSKLDSGEWGIRVTGPQPVVGQTINVSKRSGEVRSLVVGSIVSTFDGGCLCTIGDSKPENSAAPAVTVTTRPAFNPTDEQQHILKLFRTGDSIAIEAGAGTGKTSTLVYLAHESSDKRMQYVAFNRSIVDDSATKFPSNVECNTAHQLAFRAVGRNYSDRLRSSRRIRSHELAAILGLDPVNVTTWTGEQKQLSPSFLAGLVMRGIERFCQSADPEPTYRHVPLVDNLDAPHSPERPTSYAVNQYVGKALEPAMKRAWRDLSLYSGSLPFRHSHYLKLWQLSNPRIDADVILFDEAQDASPVMVDVISKQTHAQIVWVGDSQQEIYGWAGAVNALRNVPAEKRAYLTQSFRFGDAIADVANVCLAHLRAELRLSGTPSIRSTVAPVAEPPAILCRTNATAVREVLRYMREGKRPHLIGGGSDIVAFARAARDLMDGRRVEHPELACFDSWGEVQEYVQFDEQGEDLRLLVKLIDEFTVPVILDALSNGATEADADVIVSTAHKAKGREWNTIQLAGDFKDEPEGEELRLMYVAVTRAKLTLDITAVGFLREVAS